MRNLLAKLGYAARVLLSRRGGEPEIIDVGGRQTMIMSGGKGPPLVYLHSTLGESFRWLPFMDALARDFTVYVPSHPGFHKSGGFEHIDTVEDMAFHYVELFDALGIEDAVVGGVSLGGWIAAEFACRWPERVSKLFISGSPGFWVDDQPLPDLFAQMTDPAKMRKLLFADPEGPTARMIIDDNADDEKRLAAYQAMTVLARLVWKRPYNPALGRRLRRVRCPALLLWGEEDRLVPPAYGREYAKHLPQAAWKTIAKCGHLGMFEREGEWVEAVRGFAKG